MRKILIDCLHELQGILMYLQYINYKNNKTIGKV